MHPTNITENLDRCRAVFFYREDQLAPEGRRAMLQAFMSALVDTPACFVAQAFEEWIARGTRQPHPADIASRAQQLREDARDRVRLDGEGPAPTWPAPMHDHELEILLQRRSPKPSIERFREREGVSKPGAAREDRRRLQDVRERRWATSVASGNGRTQPGGGDAGQGRQRPCRSRTVTRQFCASGGESAE